MDPTEFTIITIGAYGHTEDSFRTALISAGVSLLCDIRARRGMRGRKMAWANSLRLQSTLKEAGILYCHRKDLAPPEKLRNLQKFEDESTGSSKRGRIHLGRAFTEGYRSAILDNFRAKDFFAGLPVRGGTIALFCVESTPTACHRGLFAEKLAREMNLRISHI